MKLKLGYRFLPLCLAVLFSLVVLVGCSADYDTFAASYEAGAGK